MYTYSHSESDSSFVLFFFFFFLCVRCARAHTRSYTCVYKINFDEFRYQCSKAQRELSDRLLAEATLACESAKEIIKANKEETDHRLLEKLNDIEFRKGELLRIRKDSVLEIDALSVYKERITDALKSLKRNALAICEKCLVIRSLRFLRLGVIY